MNWIASSEKEPATDPFRAVRGIAAAGSIQPDLGIIFLRFVEARIEMRPADSSARLAFAAKLWLYADTATRASANRECGATSRDFRGAKDHRSSPITLAAL